MRLTRWVNFVIWGWIIYTAIPVCSWYSPLLRKYRIEPAKVSILFVFFLFRKMDSNLV